MFSFLGGLDHLDFWGRGQKRCGWIYSNVNNEAVLVTQKLSSSAEDLGNLYLNTSGSCFYSFQAHFNVFFATRDSYKQGFYLPVTIESVLEAFIWRCHKWLGWFFPVCCPPLPTSLSSIVFTEMGGRWIWIMNLRELVKLGWNFPYFP